MSPARTLRRNNIIMFVLLLILRGRHEENWNPSGAKVEVLLLLRSCGSSLEVINLRWVCAPRIFWQANGMCTHDSVNDGGY